MYLSHLWFHYYNSHIFSWYSKTIELLKYLFIYSIRRIISAIRQFLIVTLRKSLTNVLELFFFISLIWVIAKVVETHPVSILIGSTYTIYSSEFSNAIKSLEKMNITVLKCVTEYFFSAKSTLKLFHWTWLNRKNIIVSSLAWHFSILKC